MIIILAIAAIASIVLTATLLPETLKNENKVPVNFGNMVAGSKTLFSSKSFMSLTFIGGFGMASFFVFIASASFVYTQQYGLTPTQFSIAFAINAIGFFGASQLAANFGERFGMKTVIAYASSGFAVFTIGLFLLTLAGFTSLYVLIAMLIGANACLGLIIPSTMVMAMDDHGDIAGLASSIGGTLQMLAGSAMIALLSPFFDGTSLPMTAAIALCGLCAFLDRKSTRLNSSHRNTSRMPSSA